MDDVRCAQFFASGEMTLQMWIEWIFIVFINSMAVRYFMRFPTNEIEHFLAFRNALSPHT